jgi:hypothetical protein
VRYPKLLSSDLLGAGLPVREVSSRSYVEETPVPCVWQAFHLRVTTLAGVTAYGIKQVDDNVAQSLQERSGEKVVAGSATE